MKLFNQMNIFQFSLVFMLYIDAMMFVGQCVYVVTQS